MAERSNTTSAKPTQNTIRKNDPPIIITNTTLGKLTSDTKGKKK